MKSNLLLLFYFHCTLLLSQPVLTRSNYFYIGDSTLIYHKFDSSLVGFNSGSSGANVTWDFSSMDFNHPAVNVDTILYIDPVGTPFYPVTMSADYSQSNLCYFIKSNPFSPFNLDYNYCYIDNDSLSFIGHWPDGGGNELWEDHCTDLIKLLSFPFHYQDNFIDTFSRFYFDMSGSDEHYQNGTNSVIADGYGTLITPDGITVPDILRIHTIESVRDSNLLFGITNFTQHNYYWYSSNSRGFILRLEMYRTDSSMISSAYYQKQTNTNASVNNISTNQNLLHFYPNPGKDRFSFVSALNGYAKIDTYNSFGQKIFSINKSLTNGVNELDFHDLPAGVYYVKVYFSSQDYFAGKVVVE